MDSKTIELLYRSAELLSLSKQAHESADSIRKKLQELELENLKMLERCEQTMQSSRKLFASTLLPNRKPKPEA